MTHLFEFTTASTQLSAPLFKYRQLRSCVLRSRLLRLLLKEHNSSKAGQTAVFLPLRTPQTSAMGTTQLLTGMLQILYNHDVGKHTFV